MTEIEVPIETIQENIQHHAHHHAPTTTDSWFSAGALASAVFAVFAAIAALSAGHHANEAMLEQIHASDQWNYYQAKGIKSAVLESKKDVLSALHQEIPESLIKKIEEYKKEQKEISESAQEKEHASHLHLEKHETLAKAVTFFQISIAMIAISILVKRKPLFWSSFAFGFTGLFFLIYGTFFKL